MVRRPIKSGKNLKGRKARRHKIHVAVKNATRAKNQALETALLARTLLAELSQESLPEYDQKASAVFPLANAFKSKDVLEAEKRHREEQRHKWAKADAVQEGEVTDSNGTVSHEPLM